MSIITLLAKTLLEKREILLNAFNYSKEEVDNMPSWLVDHILEILYYGN